VEKVVAKAPAAFSTGARDATSRELSLSDSHFAETEGTTEVQLLPYKHQHGFDAVISTWASSKQQ
jgi:hypothetical protein